MRGTWVGRRTFYLSFCLLSFGWGAVQAYSADLTLAEAEKFNVDQMYSYRQERYQPVDPAGDYLLYWRTKRMFRLIYEVMAGKISMGRDDIQLPAEETTEPDPQGVSPRPPRLSPAALAAEEARIRALGLSERETRERIAALRNEALSLQGDENPLSREGFNRMFLQVINEERLNGIEPSVGNPHRWSPEFVEKYGRMNGISSFSKLLVTLASGLTASYMRTDKEPELLRWILQQRHDSIGVPEMFRASYRINGGDVYLALLTIENVLAKNWRYGGRESLPATRRLKPIINGYHYDQDRFGTWYHLFGIMLYGYAESGSGAWWVGRIEALGSFILSPKTKKDQKRWMNKVGGTIGADLRKALERKKYLRQPLDPEWLRDSSYLSLNEDFRDRIHVAPDPALKVSIWQHEGMLSVHLRQLEEPLRNCTVDVLLDEGFGLRSSSVTSHRVALIEAHRTTDLYIPVEGNPGSSQRVWSVRGFVRGCDGMTGERAFEARL